MMVTMTGMNIFSAKRDEEKQLKCYEQLEEHFFKSLKEVNISLSKIVIGSQINLGLLYFYQLQIHTFDYLSITTCCVFLTSKLFL